MQGGMANPLHSPWQGTLPSPCPSSGVLFRLPSPGRSIIMAPLRTPCHGKSRTGCRLLPSFSCYGPSVYPIGQAGHGEADCPTQLIKRKPLKAAAYWYSVFRFPTFRRKAYDPKMTARRLCFKAYNKHKGLLKFFLHAKVGIFLNPYPSLWVSGYPSPNPALLRQKPALSAQPSQSQQFPRTKKTPKDFHFSERLSSA